MASLRSFPLAVALAVWIGICLGGVAGLSLFTDLEDDNGTTTSHSVIPTNASDVSTTDPNLSTEGSSGTTEGSNVTIPAHESTATAESSSPGNLTIPSGSTEHSTSTHTTEATPSSLSTGSSTPAPTTTTARHQGRKFEVASFFGGMATAVGVTIVVFVIVRCYSKGQKNRYSAM